MKVAFQKQNFPFIVLVLVLAASLGLYASHQKERRARKKDLRAELVNSSHDQSFQKFNLSGFDEQGKKFWNLEGDRAKIDTGDIVYLDDNVTLRLKDETVVRTDHVRWLQKTGFLRTESPVSVEHLKTTVHGTGAVGFLNQSFIQLNRTIDMRINDTTTITCDGPMKVFYKDNKMIFYRHVIVTDRKGVLKANRMDVFFDTENKGVDRIIAIGDVQIQREGDTTHSQRAFYTVANGAIRLEGSPEITVHKDSSAFLESGLGK